MKTLDSTYEYEAIAPFLTATTRRRTRALMTSGPRGRTKFVASLAHFRGFDPRMVSAIPPGHGPVEIARELEALGAPDECCVLSEDGDLDGFMVSLREGLSRIVGSGMGTILVARPGELAYFEGESRERFILHRERRLAAEDLPSGARTRR